MKKLTTHHLNNKITVSEDSRHPLKYVMIDYDEKYISQLINAIDVHSSMRLEKILFSGGASIADSVRGKRRIIDVINQYSYVRKAMDRGTKVVHIGAGFYDSHNKMVVIYPEAFLSETIPLKKCEAGIKLQGFLGEAVVEELAHACQPTKRSEEHYLSMFKSGHKPFIIQLILLYLGIFLTIGQIVINVSGTIIRFPVWIVGITCILAVVYTVTIDQLKDRFPHLYNTKDYEKDYFELDAKRRAKDKNLLRLANKAFKIH